MMTQLLAITDAFSTRMPLLAQDDYWTRLLLREGGANAIARDTDQLYIWLWWFCVVWFVGLTGITTYFVIKYRRRAGVPAPRSASHNTPLEIAWTVVPTIFLVVMFFMGFWGYMDKMVAPGDATELKVTGFRWSWKIEYPNGAETNAATIIGSRAVPIFYMPENKNIRLRMNSQDVMHAFWIPDYRVKADLLPNRYTQVWFHTGVVDDTKRLPKIDPLTNQPNPDLVVGQPYDDHWVFCAEYCGDEHSEMAAIIRIVPDNIYNAWLNSIGEGSLSPVQVGERVWKTKCSSCHSVDGGANTGPSWKPLFGRAVEFTNGTSYTVEQMSDPIFFANYIRDSINIPSKLIVKGYANNMTPFQGLLKENQIDGVIAYMKALVGADVAAPPAEAPSEGAGASPAISPPAN